jgi:hypothetical protein
VSLAKVVFEKRNEKPTPAFAEVGVKIKIR